MNTLWTLTSQHIITWSLNLVLGWLSQMHLIGICICLETFEIATFQDWHKKQKFKKKRKTLILRAISRVNLWGNYLCRANFTSLKEKPTAGVAIFCEKVCFSENPRFPLGVTYMWISLDVCFNLVLPVFNCVFFVVCVSINN